MRTLALALGLVCLGACSTGSGGNYNTPPDEEPPTTSTLSGAFSVLSLVDGSITGDLNSRPAPTAGQLALARIPSGTRDRVTADRLQDNGFTGSLDEVTMASSFYLGCYELSQDQWAALVAASGHPVDIDPWLSLSPSGAFGGHDGGDPAFGLSYDAVTTVIDAWNDRHADTYRLALPSDLQWEYACRGNPDNSLYAWGDEPYDSDDFFAENLGSAIGPRPVHFGTAIAPGLLNLPGNVWEWCADGKLHGGSWADSVHSSACGNTRAIPHDTPYATAGVRLIVETNE